MSKEHILLGIKAFVLITSTKEKDSFMQKGEDLLETDSRILINSFEILYCTELLIYKTGLVGIPALWVLGRWYNFRHWEPEGLTDSYRSLEI